MYIILVDRSRTGTYKAELVEKDADSKNYQTKSRFYTGDNTKLWGRIKQWEARYKVHPHDITVSREVHGLYSTRWEGNRLCAC